jgi:hypothetical protein
LREGVASNRVSLFGAVSTAYVISSSHRTHDLAQGLRGARNMPRGASQSKDEAKRAANHMHNEGMRAQK